MANELHFPLFHGYVDRWLVSGVTETPVITKPTALHGAENEKLNTAPKDKPGEEQFKAERRAKANASCSVTPYFAIRDTWSGFSRSSLIGSSAAIPK